MKNLGLCLLFSLCMQVSFAQSTGAVNSFSVPSANNAFLGKSVSNAETGVDLYSGAGQINVPICELPSRDLNIPVSLAYTSARGVRVQEYASYIGLGWQLNAGGCITRVVKSFPDEHPNGYLGTSLRGQQVAAAGTNSSAIPTAIQGTSEAVPTADGEPDMFFIRTPTFTARFVFDEYGVPVFSSNAGLKINTYNFYNSSSYSSAFFIVYDNAGNRYEFTETERSTTEIFGTSVTFPSTWYLTRITNFNQRDEVTFSYITGNPYDDKHYTTTATFDYTCDRSDETKTNTTTITNPKYLSLAQSKAGQLFFNYATDRRDHASHRLVSISRQTIYGQNLQVYSFTHSYFGDPSSDPDVLRLRLDNIKLAGNSPATSTPTTIKSFTYNTSYNLPTRTSKAFDYWGYHNSIQSYQDPFTTPALRAASNGYAQANILTKITDITGNEINLSYELNSFLEAGVPVSGGGLRITQIAKTLTTGDNVYTNYAYINESGQNSGQPYSTVYKNLHVGGYQDYQVISENPANVYDLNGQFVGYSAVKTIDQNGGYSITKFTNFSDFPDLFSGGMTVPASISYSYKRGIMKSNTVYKSNNDKVSEETHTYTSLNSTPLIKARAINTHYYYYHAKCCAERWLGVCVSQYESAVYSRTPTMYYHLVENYRLTQTVRKEYDQASQARFVEKTTNYTYCPDMQLVQSITTFDSKGSTFTKTFYHANDTGIPMVTSPETPVIAELVTANNVSQMIHETESKNSVILTQKHYKYGKNTIINGSRIFPKEVANYRGSTLLSTTTTEYNEIYTNPVTSTVDGGAPTAIMYGYNELYPVAEVTNASSLYAAYQSTAVHDPVANGGNFTTDYTGTITIGLGYASGSGMTTIFYSLSGPGGISIQGYLCRSLGGASCGSYQSGVSYNNMPAGSYYLYVTTTSNSFPTPLPTSIVYPKLLSTQQFEFYYQNFEEMGMGYTGFAHTGKKYYNATATPYAVNFATPNGRTYIIQWWNWANGKWTMNEQPYTGPRTLTGIIDDIRIYPTDAKMINYTYDPMVGKTGEIDANGSSTEYQYDGLGRQNVKRDKDKNIVTMTCFNFAGQSVPCTEVTAYSNSIQSRIFTKNDCPGGQIGAPVTYVVPAGKYTSYLGLDDANLQANNEIDLMGQAWANNPANGSTCAPIGVNLNYTDQTGVYWAYTATNTATSTVYSGTLGANFSGTLSQALPAGNYNFVFTCGSQTLSRPPKFTVNGVVQTYPGTTNITATYNNVTVAPSPLNPFIVIGFQDPVSCYFSAVSPFGIATSGMSASGGIVTFYIVPYAMGTPNYAAGVVVATINGGCAPSATRVFTKTDSSGRLWELTVSTSGQLSLRLLSGTSPGSGSYSITGCTYAL